MDIRFTVSAYFPQHLGSELSPDLTDRLDRVDLGNIADTELQPHPDRPFYFQRLELVSIGAKPLLRKGNPHACVVSGFKKGLQIIEKRRGNEIRARAIAEAMRLLGKDPTAMRAAPTALITAASKFFFPIDEWLTGYAAEKDFAYTACCARGE